MRSPVLSLIGQNRWRKHFFPIFFIQFCSTWETTKIWKVSSSLEEISLSYGHCHLFPLLNRAFWKTAIIISGLDKAFYLKVGMQVVLLSNKQNLKKEIEISTKVCWIQQKCVKFSSEWRFEPKWSKPMKTIFFPNFFYPILFNMTIN